MSLLQTVAVTCPYCGERNELIIDISVPQQEYIEDCRVCCRPMNVRVQVELDAPAVVTAGREDEA